MKLTTGAAECLSRGAAHDDPDVNAVGPNGDLFEAGQMVTRLSDLTGTGADVPSEVGAAAWKLTNHQRDLH